MKTLIVLTKIKELEDAKHPHNVPEGYIVRGWIIDKEPIVGKRFNLLHDGYRIWSTSPVTELLENDTFKTLNSLYKIERSLVADEYNVFNWIVNDNAGGK